MTKPPFFKSAEKYFEECSDKASIHGIKFFGDRSRSLFERALWFIIFTVSATMCIIYVSKTYIKWERSPLYMIVGTGQIPIHNVEFPAITICPETKIKRDIYNYSDALEKVFDLEYRMTVTERLQFEYASMVCNGKPKYLLYIEEFDVGIFDFLHNITPNMSEVFVKCRFAGIEHKCEDMFTPIFTRDGICFTFNILDRSELFQDNVQQFRDYHKAPKSVCFKEPYTQDCKDIYPRRALVSGVEEGLEVEVKVTADDLDYNCSSALQGFKVIVHDPSEIPTQNHAFFRLPQNQAVFAALTPLVISTNEKNLRAYTAAERQCYLDDEKRLLRFKHYSRSNCKIECLAYILQALECVDFYLPRTNETKAICGANYLQYRSVIEKLVISYISPDLNILHNLKYLKELFKEHNETKNTEEHCNCLPSCSSIDYRFETTQTDYHWYEFGNVDKEKRNEEYKSLLNIYFKDSEYIPMQREEMFGAMDFIAYCGGLLGLFIGCSFISLVEIVYFFTLRIGCNVRMYGRNLWYGTNETKPICSTSYLLYRSVFEKIVSYISPGLNIWPELRHLKELLKEYNDTKDTEEHCNCLPSCSSIDYRFETTQTDYHWYEFENVDKEKRNEEYKSLLNIYFKDSEYIPMQREEMFGAMDFIAYCGGLLGLFIGCSFISLVEIVYFFTLRIGCNVRMYGRNFWYGKD